MASSNDQVRRRVSRVRERDVLVGPDAPIHALWDAVTMPALAMRARQEINPGFGFILPAAEAERFAAAAPSARVRRSTRSFTITTYDDSIAAIGAFLRAS